MSRKGENIYKRKDGRWEARFIKGHRPDGTLQYGYCYGKRYREVRQKLIAARADWQAGNQTVKPAGVQWLAACCDEWLQLCQMRVKPSTYEKYVTVVERHIKPNLGSCSLAELSSLAVEQFGYMLLADARLSPKTARDVLVVLRSVLNHAAKYTDGAVPRIEITYPPVPKAEIRVLSRTEQRQFIEYLQTDTDACKFGVLLALVTGMRIGELCALRWDSISLTDCTVYVRSTMQRLRDGGESGTHKTKIVVSDPKSSTSRRLIPLTDFAVRLCEAWRPKDPSAYVLTGEPDRFIQPRTLQYRLGRYAKACGLEGVHFHTLRHTFATRCVEVDFEIKSLSEILGHANPKITLDRYVHPSFECKRDNMKKLEGIGL